MGENWDPFFHHKKLKSKIGMRATLDFTTFEARPPFPSALRASAPYGRRRYAAT